MWRKRGRCFLLAAGVTVRHLVAETGGASQKNWISDKRQGEIFSVLESTLR